jgi:hypothetical protein
LSNIRANVKYVTDRAKITDARMKQNIMGMYMLSQENPEMYEALKSNDNVSMIL